MLLNSFYVTHLLGNNFRSKYKKYFICKCKLVVLVRESVQTIQY